MLLYLSSLRAQPEQALKFIVDDASLFIVIASEPIGERGNPIHAVGGTGENITMVAKLDEIASLPLAMTTVDDASLFIVIASEPAGERGNPMRISLWLQN
jgi:hypothetical protein